MKTASGMMLALLLAGALAFAFRVQTARTAPMTITVPGDYSTIKGAITAASAGDTIVVSAPPRLVYDEGEIVISKPLSLIADGFFYVYGPTTIPQSAFYVTSDNVTIKGFTIKWGHYGIRLEDVDWCVIEGNSLFENYDGIRSWNLGDHNIIRENRISACAEYAIALAGPASFNVIERNEIVNTLYSPVYNGIHLDWCFTENLVCDNTISLNDQAGGRGIYLNRYSSQNEVRGNRVSGGGVGISIWDSDNNLIERNTVENTHIGIGLGDSNNNLVRKNTIKNVTESPFWRGGGIWLYWGRNYYNIVEKNFVVECYDGISIEQSCFTDVHDNLVMRGTGYGLAVTANSNSTMVEGNIVLLNQQCDLYWDQTGTDNTWTGNHYLTKNW